MRVEYGFGTDNYYESDLIVIPSRSELKDVPDLMACAKSGKTVPISCLAKCEVTKNNVLKHLLIKIGTK